ncbi:MAG: hypothetical protein ACLTLQ_10885 [[Clostridium] scindens]
MTVIKVTKPNMAQKGVIKVSKTGEVFSTVTESNGCISPVYDVAGLSGAVFEITAWRTFIRWMVRCAYSAGEIGGYHYHRRGWAQPRASLSIWGKFKVKEIEFPTAWWIPVRMSPVLSWLTCRPGGRDHRNFHQLLQPAPESTGHSGISCWSRMKPSALV